MPKVARYQGPSQVPIRRHTMDHKEDNHSALHIPQVPADGQSLTAPDFATSDRHVCFALVRRTSSALNCRLSNHLTICPIRSATCAVERKVSRRLCDMEESPSQYDYLRPGHSQKLLVAFDPLASKPLCTHPFRAASSLPS